MSYVSHFQNLIEKELQLIIQEMDKKSLYAPISYVLSIGGKRIRPALCLSASALFDAASVDNCIAPALGIEIFHNFTLLHDDIMDNSLMRRNHPTVHVKWNKQAAILSGDAMMVKAYQYISKSPPSVLLPILNIFNRTSLEVCEGQQLDMEFEDRHDVSEKEYIEMIGLKTAVLLGASLHIGALIGGASDRELDLLYQFGLAIGISFQLQDDWLDTFGNSETFGKDIGGDIVSNKKTLLLIYALNSLSGSALRELKAWILKKEFDREEKISVVRNLYEEANVSVFAKNMMNKYYQRSLDLLNRVGGNTEIKNDLASFATELMKRSR